MPDPYSTDKLFALLHRLSLFHLHLLLEFLLAEDGDVVLVGEVMAVEGFGQLLNQHLCDGPLKFLLL